MALIVPPGHKLVYEIYNQAAALSRKSQLVIALSEQEDLVSQVDAPAFDNWRQALQPGAIKTQERIQKSLEFRARRDRLTVLLARYLVDEFLFTNRAKLRIVTQARQVWAVPEIVLTKADPCGDWQEGSGRLDVELEFARFSTYLRDPSISDVSRYVFIDSERWAINPVNSLPSEARAQEAREQLLSFSTPESLLIQPLQRVPRQALQGSLGELSRELLSLTGSHLALECDAVHDKALLLPIERLEQLAGKENQRDLEKPYEKQLRAVLNSALENGDMTITKRELQASARERLKTPGRISDRAIRRVWEKLVKEERFGAFSKSGRRKSSQ